MKISTKGKYCIAILLELALADYLMSARELSNNQEISIKYTEKILGILSKAGFIYSQRGSLGGYTLAHLPQQITVSQVLRATEGKFEIVEGLNNINHNYIQDCLNKSLWYKMQISIEEIADNTTIQDLVDDCTKKENFFE